ncbi:MAG: hypothetical protein QNJ97_07485 [Myxococcota bacterium]|nr:hypothetical protein [Myxococcota bacterium]
MMLGAKIPIMKYADACLQNIMANPLYGKQNSSHSIFGEEGMSNAKIRWYLPGAPTDSPAKIYEFIGLGIGNRYFANKENQKYSDLITHTKWLD